MTRNTRIEQVSIDDLLLDARNPRFGRSTGSSSTQKELLANIVDNHGISDLLTSMSINGYFDAEPVVAVQGDDGKYTVVEGNRRLATALILTGDDRASGYSDIARKYQFNVDLQKINSLKRFPVSVFPDRNSELIAYIGTKHIRGNKPWDSFAKATWLFDLLTESLAELSISEAARLLGDQNTNTVKRILEGYVLMNQLQEERSYNPDDSQIRGRGSNMSYPFSWVYTAIGYENIRNWIDITSLSSEARIDQNVKVLKTREGVDNGEKLVIFLFGSRSKNVNSVVSESRKIRLLNDVVEDKLAVLALENGEKLENVWDEQRPANERLLELLYRNEKDLGVINNLVSGLTLTSSDQRQFISMGEKSISILRSIVTTLKSVKLFEIES